VSSTWTFAWQLAVLPEGSVAVHVPNEDPTGNVPGAQLAVQLQLSEHVNVGVAGALLLPVHCTVTSEH
jgi:hypothetical protein